MEDLSLDTPPIIIKNKPKVSLEAIPISPGFLDNTPSILSESDQSVSDQSVLNDSTPIENNWKTSMIRDGFYIDFGYE